MWGERSAWGNGHVGKLLRVRGSGSVAYEGGCEYLCEGGEGRRRGGRGEWEGKVSRLAVRSGRGGVEGEQGCHVRGRKGKGTNAKGWCHSFPSLGTREGWHHRLSNPPENF